MCIKIKKKKSLGFSFSILSPLHLYPFKLSPSPSMKEVLLVEFRDHALMSTVSKIKVVSLF